MKAERRGREEGGREGGKEGGKGMGKKGCGGSEFAASKCK
jgi:hypothetical protein